MFSADRDAGQWLGAAREAGRAEQLGPHASGVTWELKGRGESLTSGWGVLVRAGDWGAGCERQGPAPAWPCPCCSQGRCSEAAVSHQTCSQALIGGEGRRFQGVGGPALSGVKPPPSTVTRVPSARTSGGRGAAAAAHCPLLSVGSGALPLARSAAGALSPSCCGPELDPPKAASRTPFWAYWSLCLLNKAPVPLF